MRNIWKTVSDRPFITIEPDVRFQWGICPEKFELDVIKNDRLVAIIDYNMRKVWKTVPDHYYKTKCAASGRDMPWKKSTR